MTDKKPQGTGITPKRRKRGCPRCGSLDVVPILYGYPGPEMMDMANKREIELGGCCVTDRDPRKHCKACGEVFDRPSVRRSRQTRGNAAGSLT
jgi:hypothetical protein